MHAPRDPIFGTPRHSAPAQLAGLVGWLALTFVAAACGALASLDAAIFYA